MTDIISSDLSTLDAEEYLIDPPETVWEDVLLVDHISFLDIKDLEIMARAQEATNQYSESIPREAWMGLYAPINPLKKTVSDSMCVAKNIFQRAIEMPEWKRLQSCAGMDPVAAAFGAAHFSKELINNLPPEVKDRMEEAQQDRNQVSQLENRIQALRMVADSIGDAGEQNGQGNEQLQDLQQQADDLESCLAQAVAKVHQSSQAAAEAMDRAEARVRHAMAQATSKSADDLSDLKDAAQEFGFGWGFAGGAGATREQIEGLHELADFLRKSKYLKMILDTLGWAKKMVSAERRKSKHGRERFTHFRVQDLEMESLAPQEILNMLAFPVGSDIHTDFLCRALDGDLLHAQYEGDDHAGRGPMVYLRDESGSMRGWQRAVACAVQLALMLEACKDNRRFISIPFSGEGQYAVYDPGRRPDPMELLEHLELTYGKGTEPFAPLMEAIRLIKEDESLREGDVLCLTDGQFGRPPDEFLELLEEAREDPGLRVVAVVINGRKGQADFADKVIMIGDIFRERERLAEAISAVL
jgi:uncharacterized protein with von Willebrand factor type A (vWA) domain